MYESAQGSTQSKEIFVIEKSRPGKITMEILIETAEGEMTHFYGTGDAINELETRDVSQDPVLYLVGIKSSSPGKSVEDFYNFIKARQGHTNNFYFMSALLFTDDKNVLNRTGANFLNKFNTTEIKTVIAEALGK